jgi:hypothetical protein
MPKRFYVINLTSGGEEGRVTYNVPASASISECNTRLALARRDGFDTVEQKIEALQRETEALVTLATESLRMLHDEWDGYKSDIILTKEEKESWAEDYGTFAIRGTTGGQRRRRKPYLITDIREDINATLEGRVGIKEDADKPTCGQAVWCEKLEALVDDVSRKRACLSCMRKKHKRDVTLHVCRRLTHIYIWIANISRADAGLVSRWIQSGIIDYTDLEYIAEARRLWP